jgi:hypothetical protein
MPPAPLRAFARDAKLTAALAVAVVELTVRLVKKWRKTSPARSAEISMMVAGDTDQRLGRLCCGLISDNNSHERWTS